MKHRDKPSAAESGEIYQDHRAAMAANKKKAFAMCAEALKMMHGEPLKSGEVLVYFFEYPQIVSRLNKVLSPFGVRLRVRSAHDDGVFVRAELVPAN